MPFSNNKYKFSNIVTEYHISLGKIRRLILFLQESMILRSKQPTQSVKPYYIPLLTPYDIFNCSHTRTISLSPLFRIVVQQTPPNHNSYLQLQRRKKHVDSYGKAKTIRPRNECTSREEAYREPMESGVFFRSDVLDEVSINPDGT